MWSSGLVAVINLACRAFTNSDEAILTMVQIYPPFVSAPHHAQRKLFTSELLEQNN